MTPCRIEDVLASEGVYAATTWGTHVPHAALGPRHRHSPPAPGPLRCYDVPLYRVGEKYVLHRVIRVLPEGYLIRGDNCLTTERVQESQVIGVLTGFYRDDRPVDLSGTGYCLYCRIWCALSPLWRLYRRVSSAAASLLCRLHKKRPAD